MWDWEFLPQRKETPAVAHSQVWVSVLPLSHPLLCSPRAWQPNPPQSPLHRCNFSESARVVCHLSSLVVLLDFSFNSLVVGVPCSLIFLALLVVYWFKTGCYPPFGCASKRRVSTYASILVGTVYALFNVFLDVVCQYFVEDFSIYVYQEYWPVVFFLCCVFIWFGDWNDSGYVKRVWESSLLLNFLE